MADDKRRIWITAMCILLGFGAYIYTAFHTSKKNVSIVSESRGSTVTEMVSDLSSSGNTPEEIQAFPVYICGEVLSPGIFELTEPVFLYELIEMAGGLTEEADAASIDMVYRVEYAQSICIPAKKEGEGNEDTKIRLNTEPPWEKTDSSFPSEQGKININTSGKDVLCTLPGIGEKTAENIVAFREEHGPFSSVDQIMQVQGIGESKFNRIKDQICV